MFHKLHLRVEFGVSIKRYQLTSSFTVLRYSMLLFHFNLEIIWIIYRVLLTNFLLLSMFLLFDDNLLKISCVPHIIREILG